MNKQIAIYLDADDGDDNNSGTIYEPVQTLERAFNLIPRNWGGRVLITGEKYGFPKQKTDNTPLPLPG
jgi:hypothetical protein